jgi:hypothetical protein
MTYVYSPIAAEVECEDCSWVSESYKNAQAIAAKHAKKYGHKVRGELTIFFTYNYRKKEEKK